LIIIAHGFSQAHLFTESATDAQVSIDGIGKGYGLRIKNGCGGPLIKTAVVFIYTVYWARLAALTATGAYIRINVTGVVPQYRTETTGRTFQGFDFRVGNDVDIQVPADLDQFRGNDSHGAIIRRKGFIQLCHDSPDARGPVN
jgi:hypothetical protein